MNDSWDIAWQLLSNAPAIRVLRAIQLRGRASIKDVAGDLEVTPSAVRQHLAQLEAGGAIRTEKVREGVGRPYHLYSVTPEGHALFHRGDGDLAGVLLDEIARVESKEAFQEILQRVSDRLAELYRRQVDGSDLEERVRAWIGMLDGRGVMAEVEDTDEGYVLREYGCLYQPLATENRAMCDIERQVLSQLLDSGVRLQQCVLDGAHGCQFCIESEKGV